MKMERFCPECLDYTPYEVVEIPEVFNIKGEKIEVNSRYLKCESCGETFPHSEFQDENYEKAYSEYRRRKNLLQPHEIKEIRQQYHLSQRQLAKILGWSHATLSRYETGAIQDTSHNNELVLLRNPENMLEILETNSVNLSEKELKRLKRNVYDMVERDKSRKINILLEQFFCDEPDIMNGYKRFDLDKLVQTVKFFAIKDNKLYKLKLMKYLWYSDFLHFKRHTVSINGLRYAHLPIGPAPDRHDLLIALLLEQSDHIFREYEDFGYEHPGEKFKAVGPLDDSLFDEEELITLNDVYESLNHHSGMSGSDYSHQESAWLKTTNGELISYEFAKELSLIH